MRQEIRVTSVHLHTEQEGGDLGLKKKSQFFPCVVTVPLSLLSALVRRPGKLLISPLYILFSQVDLEKSVVFSICTAHMSLVSLEEWVRLI